MAAADTSIIAEVFKIIPQFKIPGISRIQIHSSSLVNQIRLDAINFPDNLIPAHFKCELTNEVMARPCADSCVPATIIDYTAFIKTLDEKDNKSPYTRQFVNRDEIIFDIQLAAEIECLIQKAEWIYHTFKNGHQYNQLYISSSNPIRCQHNTAAVPTMCPTCSSSC